MPPRQSPLAQQRTAMQSNALIREKLIYQDASRSG